MKNRLKIAAAIIISMCITACGANNTVMPSSQSEVLSDVSEEKLVIYSPHSITIQWNIVKAFEEQTGIEVDVVSQGTGDAMKRIEAEASDPQADIMWGGTVALLNANKECFEYYSSPNEKDILPAYRNTSGYVTSFTLVPSVLIVNTELSEGIKINGYADLLNPALKGRIAHCDPEKSSSSYEQVINMLNAMGHGNPEDGWDYVEKLAKNFDADMLTSSSAVYKSVVSGENIVGLTYEEGAISNLVDGAPVEVVYMEEGVICRADGVAIIKNAKNLENAKKFVDFVTSAEAQEIVTQKLNRRSIRADIPPLKGIKDYSQINIILDDVDWATENKKSVIEKFHAIFNAE